MSQNALIDNLVDSIKATLTDANMMGFESYAEQTVAFFQAVRFFLYFCKMNSFTTRINNSS